MYMYYACKTELLVEVVLLEERDIHNMLAAINNSIKLLSYFTYRVLAVMCIIIIHHTRAPCVLCATHEKGASHSLPWS